MNEFKIENYSIGSNYEPFIIAEMSGNHNQSLDRALEIVDAVASTGAHAIKLQTYTADTMTLNIEKDEFLINDPDNLWKGRNLYELYEEAHTPWEWHGPIFKRAKQNGLICFSSPFDDTAVDFLEDLNVPAYKIASFENIHLPLIKKVASTGKPIIISTGMANLAELEDIISVLETEKCKNFILLKCTSTYPASPENSNILTIPFLKKLFGCEVGLSDHTMGIGTSVAAVAHGATVIEKHFTLNRNDGGVDSQFSLEPQEMRQLVNETKRAWQSLGEVFIGPSEKEKLSLKYRRSIYTTKDLKKGDKINKNNIRIVRPGMGLPPKYFDIILGRRVISDVKRGTPVIWELIK